MIIEKTTTVEKEKLLVNYEDQMASYELQFHAYIVDTLKTGYPRVQAPSQDKRQGNSRPAACLRGSGAFLPAQGRGHHVSPWLRLSPPDSGYLQGRHVSLRLWLLPLGLGQLRGCHMSSGLQHPPSSSGRLWSCHVSRGRALQAAIN
jgi:hypothetical protein